MRHRALGASLYVPATRDDLVEIATGQRYPDLRSVIFCTEDALYVHEVELALQKIAQALPYIAQGRLQCFVRVRNLEVLDRVLAMEGVEHLDGFVLPKVDLRNFADSFDRLLDRPGFRVMPTLETRDVFDPSAMCRLRDAMLEHPIHNQILALRIGGNDLMRLLEMRRDPSHTVYQTVLGSVISRLVTTFRPYGLPLTAPVYDSFSNPDVLAEEVRADLAHGLTAKTAIHPNQVAVIHSQYAVSSSELLAAEQLLDANRPAVFGLDGVMHERTTHLPWAEGIRERAQHFGVLSGRDRSSDQLRIPYVFHG